MTPFAERIASLCRDNQAHLSDKMRVLLYYAAAAGPDGGEVASLTDGETTLVIPKRTVDFAVGVVEMMEQGLFDQARAAVEAVNLSGSGPSA